MTETSNNPIGITVDTIKDALRIDGSNDDALIQGYIDTAKDYVSNAVGESVPMNGDTKYNLAVILLVQFWYSNRTIDMKQTPYQVRSLIQQLRGEYWQQHRPERMFGVQYRCARNGTK